MGIWGEGVKSNLGFQPHSPEHHPQEEGKKGRGEEGKRGRGEEGKREEGKRKEGRGKGEEGRETREERRPRVGFLNPSPLFGWGASRSPFLGFVLGVFQFKFFEVLGV